MQFVPKHIYMHPHKNSCAQLFSLFHSIGKQSQNMQLKQLWMILWKNLPMELSEEMSQISPINLNMLYKLEASEHLQETPSHKQPKIRL